MDEMIGDIIGFFIAFMMLLTIIGGSLKKQQKRASVPIAKPPEVEKRIPKGRRLKPALHEFHEEHHEVVQSAPATIKEKPKPSKAQKMLIHYEILSPPKAFRNK